MKEETEEDIEMSKQTEVNARARYLGIVLILFLFFAGMTAISTQTIYAATDTGSCGDGVTYQLTDAGVLTISGTGTMNNYDANGNNHPWAARRSEVKTVVVNNGVTLGKNAFANHTAIQTATIYGTMTTIPEGTFYRCSQLKTVTLPETVTRLENSSFSLGYNAMTTTSPTINGGSNITEIVETTFSNLDNLGRETVTSSVVEIKPYRAGKGDYAGQMFEAVVKVNGTEQPSDNLFYVWKGNHTVENYKCLSFLTPDTLTTKESINLSRLPGEKYGSAYYTTTQLTCSVFKYDSSTKKFKMLGKATRDISKTGTSSDRNTNELAQTFSNLGITMFEGESSETLLNLLAREAVPHIECGKVYLIDDSVKVKEGSATDVVTFQNTGGSAKNIKIYAAKNGQTFVQFGMYTNDCTFHGCQGSKTSPFEGEIKVNVIGQTPTPTKTTIKIDLTNLPGTAKVTLGGVTKTVTPTGGAGTVIFDNLTAGTTYDYTIECDGAKSRGLSATTESDHVHSFEYAAGTGNDTNKITATCTNKVNCPLNNQPVTLTIKAPAKTTYGDSKSPDATLDNLSDFNTITSDGVATSDIVYYNATKNPTTGAYTKGSELTTGAPSNAGDYIAEITVHDKKAYVGYTIAKASTTIITAPSASAITYGQKLENSSLTGGSASVAGSFTWDAKDTKPLVSDSNHTEYDVVFTPTDSNYAPVTCKVKLTVNKAEVTPPTIQSKVYNSKTQTADLTIEDSTPYTVTKNDGGIEVDSYNVILTLKDTANYKWKDSTEAAKTLEFKITPAPAPEVVVPTPDAVTYDPTKTLEDVTLTGGWEWTDDTKVPTVGNSGYTAALTVDDKNYDYTNVEGYDKNTHKVTRTVALTVNKAEVTAPAIQSKVYNGETQTADVPQSTLYKVTKNDGGIEVDSYDVVLTLEDPGNYKWKDSTEAAKTLEFKITPAPAPEVVVPTPDAVTYDPAKTLEDVTLPEGWEWTDDTKIPTVGNSGYTAVLTVDDKNYDYTNVEGYDKNTHKVTRTVALTVNKAEVTAPTIESKVYNGETQTADVPQSTLYKVTKNDGGIAVDSYDVVLTLEDPGNYKWKDSTEAAKTLEFKITPAPVIIKANPKEVTYDGRLIDVPVNGMFVIPEGAGKATYTVTLGTGGGIYDAVTGKLNVLKAGTFTIKVTTAATDNYLAGEAIAVLTVKKGDGIGAVRLDDQEAGKDYEPTITSSVYSTAAADLTIKYFKKEGDSYVALEDKPKDVGEYKVVVTFKENDLYKEKTVEDTFKIVKTPEPEPEPGPDPKPIEDITYDDLTEEEKVNADKLAEAYGTDKDTAAKMLKTGEEYGVSMDTMLLTTEKLTNLPNDKDPKGTTFSKLRARAVKRTKTTMVLQWKKQTGADGYLIYTNRCGRYNKMKLKKTVKNPNTVKWNRKKLKKGKYYKYTVVAYKNVNGQKLPIAASCMVHCTTKAKSNTIAKGVKVNKTKVTLAAGKTFKIKAKEIKAEKGKVIRPHRVISYESSKPEVAKVEKKTGKVTAVAAGTTYIYAYAQDGVYKKIKVTVK